MNGIADFVLLLAILLAAGMVIVKKVKKIRKRGFGCDCGCGSCPSGGCAKGETKDKGDFS